MFVEDESIVIFIDIPQVFGITINVILRPGSSEILVGIESFVEIRHGGQIGLQGSQVKYYLHLGNKEGLLGLKSSQLLGEFFESIRDQDPVVGTVVQNFIQRSYGNDLKSFVQGERQLIYFILQMLLLQGGIRRVQLISRNFFRDSPANSQRIQAIGESEDGLLASFLRGGKELDVVRIEFLCCQLLLYDIVLLEVGAQVVLLSQANSSHQSSELLGLIAVVEIVFRVDGAMSNHVKSIEHFGVSQHCQQGNGQNKQRFHLNQNLLIMMSNRYNSKAQLNVQMKAIYNMIKCYILYMQY